jgi:hypothetical protein
VRCPGYKKSLIKKNIFIFIFLEVPKIILIHASMNTEQGLVDKIMVGVQIPKIIKTHMKIELKSTKIKFKHSCF